MSAAGHEDVKELHDPGPMTKAREDLSWFFGASESAVGLQAQGYEGNTAESVWDDRRINALHVRMLTYGRQAIARRNRISDLLLEMPPDVVRDLRAVYTPFGWGRLSGGSAKDKDRANWAVWCRFSMQGRQLLPLALETPEMMEAYRRKHEGADCPSREILLRFVCAEVASIRDENVRPGKALPTGHSLTPSLRAADRRETEASALYDRLREEQSREAKRRRAMSLDAVLEALKADEVAAIERRLRRMQART